MLLASSRGSPRSSGKALIKKKALIKRLFLKSQTGSAGHSLTAYFRLCVGPNNSATWNNHVVAK